VEMVEETGVGGSLSAMAPQVGLPFRRDMELV
jgi:hypothetical protein